MVNYIVVYLLLPFSCTLICIVLCCVVCLQPFGIKLCINKDILIKRELFTDYYILLNIKRKAGKLFTFTIDCGPKGTVKSAHVVTSI